MRLWSLHPKYLDATGLVACWRESLLAQKVLMGLTKGYTKHPQLIRFKTSADSIEAIGAYLKTLYDEAKRRNYSFDYSKIQHADSAVSLPVTEGQLMYEMDWLRSKQRVRSLQFYERFKSIEHIEPNPIFRVVEGAVEPWEVVSIAK